jgi:U3 small nucleolar ribonucleoprotein protein IMP4
MIRRDARLRREYLYRKSLEGALATQYEKKRSIRDALESGRPIPTELRASEPALRALSAADDAQHAAPRSHVDDEYARAGETDPRVVVTTSRDPSSRLGQFAKELRLMFPGAQRLNRGGMVVADLISACRGNEVTDLVIAHEHRGEPDGLVVCHLPYGPTAFFSLTNVVMRHDIRDAGLGTVSEARPHLIFHGFHSALGKRTSDVLRYLFPVPKDDSKRIMTFVNEKDAISVRHHVYSNPSPGRSKSDIALNEVGPRFEMHLYQLRLGTLDQPEADDEWVLRPHMNSAKRRKSLG